MSSSPFRRILVPIDFTEDTDASVHSGFEVELDVGKVAVASASARSLELAAGIIDSEVGEVRLVHATPTYDSARIYTGATGLGMLAGTIEEIHESSRVASLRALEMLAEQFAPGIKCSFAVRPAIALEMILEEARTFEAQLIVVAASGRGRVARFFLGSTADRVIREASCPVLVVPPLMQGEPPGQPRG